MYLSYDTTETYIERQDYKISMLRTKEDFPYVVFIFNTNHSIGGSRGGVPGACPPYRVEMNVFSGSQGTYCGVNETKKKHDEVRLKVKTFQISMTMANIYFYNFLNATKHQKLVVSWGLLQGFILLDTLPLCPD